MRKTTIAIRIPKVEFQPSHSPLNVCIKGTSDIFNSATPKERVRLSREYKRCNTPISPVVYVPTSPTAQTPKVLKPRQRPEFKPFNIIPPTLPSSSINLCSNQNSTTSSMDKKKQIRPKQEIANDSLFDLFTKEKEMTRYLALENELFPKDCIQNIKYIPDNHYLRFGSYHRNRIQKANTPKSSRDSSQRYVSGLRFLVKSRNELPRLKESYVGENKVNHLLPKLMKNKENK